MHTKKRLTESPYVFEFEYRAKEEGYRSYEYMVLQFEDCADCLRVLYPNKKFVFMLDHSCGHYKQREDGLNAGNMGKALEEHKQSYEILTLKRRRVILDPSPLF